MTERTAAGLAWIGFACSALAWLGGGGPLAAQEGTATARVVVEGEGTRIVGAEVRAGRTGALTDDSGIAVLRLPAGTHTLVVRRIGYARGDLQLELRPGADTTVVVTLEPAAVEAEAIVVASTRTDRRLEDEPIRVEVLGREEIEEKMLMTPGDISMLLNETSGLRVQTTSPGLGGANVRIQGLRGRYTQMLADGLPLYGGQSGVLGMLQVPPMDLGQVEVIKGVASALYGASALGGVVNLISRRPDGERELLLNHTSHNGTDVVLWTASEPATGWSHTLLASGHRQLAHDIGNDGWADIAGYRRGVLRPRLFWSDGLGRSLFVTIGVTVENREGGTLAGATTPAGLPHPEALDTRRGDLGLVGRTLVGGDRLLSLRASAMRQRHRHLFGEVRERDDHTTAFAELSLRGEARGHAWVGGIALQHEAYAAEDVPVHDYAFTTPSLFVQDEISPAEWLTVATSLRWDLHSEYGGFLNPRVSVLLRPGAEWNVRVSAGTGYFAPTPFTEETEAIGLARLEPPTGLEAERARSASLDIGRTLGPVELNATLFGSEIRDALLLRATDGGRVELFNAVEPTRTYGTDLLARYLADPLHLTATYTYTRSTEQDREAGMRREVPLTPRHAAGIVGIAELHESRIGLELYYTGRQALDEDPFRSVSRPYFVVGLLGERRIGRVRVYLNAENLFDARQSRFDPLLRPSRSRIGRWTTDAWAPLEGRSFNAGVRWEF